MLRAASMEYIFTPIAVARIASKRKRTRFAEQMWTVLYYSTTFCVGTVSKNTTIYFFHLKKL
jgi:hypothetical protein